MSILITDARIADTAQKTTSVCDILVNGTVIEKIAPRGKLKADATETYNAAGRFVVPAFTDMHTHLREPGYTSKETVKTATAAAVLGGYGAVTAMPNTMPVTDSQETLAKLFSIAKRDASCDVYATAAITSGEFGADLCDYDALAKAGALAFTDDGRPVSDAGVMYRAMKALALHDRLMISHSEELSLTADGVITEGLVSRQLGVKGIPSASESAAVARDIELAEQSGCRLHIAHVSTARSVSLIREAKKRGVRISAETCPHYFSLTVNDVLFYGVNAKMKPPLGTARDVDAVIAGLADGTIDVISTDHAPHTTADKGDLKSGAFGIIGLQTAFPVAYTYLVLSGKIDFYRLVQLMCENPAKLLGTDGGIIAEGAPASLTVLDTDDEFTLADEDIVSRSHNTPYIDMALYGSVNAVMVRGKWKYNIDE